MIKPQKRMIGVVAVLVMLGISPISVTYSFADYENNQDYKVREKSLEIIENNGFEVILTEKVVDGKLKVQHYALPNTVTEKDMQRALSIEEENVLGWAYVNYKEYHSGIVLFDGVASKLGDNLWEISLNDTKNSEQNTFDTKLVNETDEFGLKKDNSW